MLRDKRFFRGVLPASHTEVLGRHHVLSRWVAGPDDRALKFIAESGRYDANFHSASFQVGGAEQHETTEENKKDARNIYISRFFSFR